MAQSSAKKLIKANSQRLKSLFLTIFISNIIFALIRVVLFYSTFTKLDAIVWLILFVTCTLPFALLHLSARPTYDTHGTIISGGEDISAPGMLEYAHDLIYLTVFVQLAFILSRWALLLFTLIPTYAIYLSCFSASSALPDLQTDDTSDSSAGLSRKERRKVERQARKQR